MIKKLSQRIFLIIMISLSVVILGVIILFAFFNYTNTIEGRFSAVERFGNIGMKAGPNARPDELINIQPNLNGVYNIIIENSKIIQNTDRTRNEDIEKYAIKLSKQNKESGIIDKYIYKIRKTKENRVNVTIIQDEEAISHIQKIYITSIIIAGVALVMIYIIAKKLSKTIVKPVEETFEKQKQFISDASHELKTPLAVIEANTDVLENEVGNNKWLNYIQNETESMNKLINELLLLAKIENVDNIKEYKEFDISKEVEIIVSMFESMSFEKDVKISSNIQENITMNGNKEDLEHILSTLIDNAIKHTEPQKEVMVELSKEKNEVILQVKNMGEPIPEEERKKIFERFYRIDKSRNRKEKRYGLGLSIAKSTVEKYKGKIEVLYKDEFTIFKVSIPG